jgi:hypothetical protein
MSDDLEKLINRALLHWKACEISLHFHGRKKGGVTWIARAYLSHTQVQARLVESGTEGSKTLEKLTAIADRRVTQGHGKTAIEAVKAMVGTQVVEAIGGRLVSLTATIGIRRSACPPCPPTQTQSNRHRADHDRCELPLLRRSAGCRS